ncbi:hypothetical protein [Streptomyces pseudovenezuelae]|uniref:Lipoprotein n=1 Tax=Streptomyces pseudovenezuelae TaxID=67350 RepID=A0ABT6LJQ7_9ACTN|nr:hypothetical protein [Streptomyces pseudovenezuelae]MDH6216545.1 hypothetical protein [Streptomyces pseudovenezuelae]
MCNDRHPQRNDPRPHRVAALATGAAALTAVLLATGCDGTTSVTAAAASAQDDKGGSAPRFTTLRFTLDARGGVQLTGGSRAAATAAGSFSVTGGRTHRFDRPGDRLLVVLRHWPDSGTERASRGRAPQLLPPDESAVETGFLVDTASWVRAELDGQSLRWLRRDTLRVDVTDSAVGEPTVLTLSGPHGGRSGQPVPPPLGTRACASLDADTARHAVLPEVATGTDVPDALARLSGLCLDVQYATRPGGTPGTVRQVLVPLAGHPTTSAALPPTDGTAPTPGDRVLLDPTRPATLVVAR